MNRKLFLDNLYDNTMGIHNQKHVLISKQLAEISDASLYLNFYISDITDLLLHFNSFLLLYNTHTSQHNRANSFKHQSNSNNLYDLTFNALKGQMIYSGYAERMRIYEYFFRHMYAHGNGNNLINMLLARNSNSPPFFMFLQKAKRIKNNKIIVDSSLRLLLDKTLFHKYKHFLLKIFNNKNNPPFFIKKIIYDSDTSKGEYFYLLSEDATRSYIKLSNYKKNFINSVKNQHTLNRFFNSNYSQNTQNLIVCGIMKNEKDRIKIPSSYIDYYSIRQDIESIIFYLANS